MKTKRFLALFVALTMVISIVPAMTAQSAETTTMAELLGGDVIWSAPNKGGLNDTAVSSVWIGWSSSGNFANLRTYDGYDVLQFYSASQTDCAATVTASDEVKEATKDSDMLIIEWKHKGQPESDNYYDFTFVDADNSDIAAVTIDKNMPEVSDTHKMGFPANYTPMAIVAYNDPGSETHTVEYYVAGEKVYTDSSIEGTINGFGSIKGDGGWWSNYSHIGFADLTISTVTDSESIVKVTAQYIANDLPVATQTARYNTAKGETEAVFPEFNYSANGDNVLYHADEVRLSRSDNVMASVVPNTGNYNVGSVVACDGVQYNIAGKNLIPNADFAYGLAGWYTGDGNMATPSNFRVSDGKITVLNGTGSESSAGLFRAWDVEIGKTYYFTYNASSAVEWTRLTEGKGTSYSDTTKTLLGQNGAVSGRNSIVFTASDEYFRASFAWCQSVTLSDFGLYEVTEASQTITEGIASVETAEPLYVFSGDSVNLPAQLSVEGSLGTKTAGSVVWSVPDKYSVGKNTVNGTLTVKFSESADPVEQSVTYEVNVFEPDNVVDTFYSAGDDSNSPSFNHYNYVGSYNGGIIMSDADFNAGSGTNKLIVYGNASTSAFGNAAALLRYFNTQSNGQYVFEYHDGSWKTSDVVCKYNTNYTLRTIIDITNKTYTLLIREDGGEFIPVTPRPAAFRNSGVNSIDRMVYTGTVSITGHKTAWINGFSILNVVFADNSGNSLRDGYTSKCATGGIHYVDSAPKLIESADKIYIRENVDSTPAVAVTEDMTYTVTYNEVTMTGVEDSYVIHVRGDVTLNMPAKVKMTFSDSQTISYPVVWDTSSVDKNSVGVYTATGSIAELPSFTANCTVEVKDVEILPYTSQNTVATNNGGWNWYVEPSGTHIQPGDTLASRYESGIYSTNGGYQFKHDRTYMGWVEDGGDIVIAQYDHDEDTYTRVVIHKKLESDDHNNPAVVILPDGRIMAVYSMHTNEPYMYYRVTKNPEDITEWNKEQFYLCHTSTDSESDSYYNATYPTVFMVHDDEGVQGNDTIYMGWRGVHWKPTMAKFSMPDENGVCEVKMGQTQFANTSYSSKEDGGRGDGGRRPYTKYDYDFERNKIYITFTSNHPDNDNNNHVYYLYLNIEDQNLYTAKDTFLQPLPKENQPEYKAQGAVVNGANTNGQWGVITDNLVGTYPELFIFNANEQVASGGGERRGWTWDISHNEKGEPCVVYVDVTATPPGEDGSLPAEYHWEQNGDTRTYHYYWYARWDSASQEWVKTFLTYGGKWWHENATQERCYSGGLTFDHNADDANVLFLAIPTMGEYGNMFEIYRWESEDHGATWTIREPLTQNSKANNARPNAIYNYKEDEDGNHAGPRLLWISGEYRYWMNYEYKTGVMTDFAADGFITQDDPEMFADAALYQNGELLSAVPVGSATVTGKFNITNISIGDGNVTVALAHYNKDGALVNVTTQNVYVPARSVPQTGILGAPKMPDGSLSKMGDDEIKPEIEYSATFAEGDRISLMAWNVGIEQPLSSIMQVPFSMTTSGDMFSYKETFTYEGDSVLYLNDDPDNYNGWIGHRYFDGSSADCVDDCYAGIIKAPFGNTSLHLYHKGDGGVMASHTIPEIKDKDVEISFSVRYINEWSWNNTANAGFSLSHGMPKYANDIDTASCAFQFRHGSAWGQENGRGNTGYVRRTRWFDGNELSWLFMNDIPRYMDTDNMVDDYYVDNGNGNNRGYYDPDTETYIHDVDDSLMVGALYRFKVVVSPTDKTVTMSINDGYRTVTVTESYVDSSTYDWDNNPIDTITFNIGNDKWGEMYVDDLTVKVIE